MATEKRAAGLAARAYSAGLREAKQVEANQSDQHDRGKNCMRSLLLHAYITVNRYAPELQDRGEGDCIATVPGEKPTLPRWGFREAPYRTAMATPVQCLPLHDPDFVRTSGAPIMSWPPRDFRSKANLAEPLPLQAQDANIQRHETMFPAGLNHRSVALPGRPNEYMKKLHIPICKYVYNECNRGWLITAMHIRQLSMVALQ